MTEYTYRIERDFTPEVNRIAAYIQHKIDQAALDKAADTLEQFGYVKVVRCRDCKHFMRGNLCSLQDEWNEFHWLDVEPSGFCAWASKRKEGGE